MRDLSHLNGDDVPDEPEHRAAIMDEEDAAEYDNELRKFALKRMDRFWRRGLGTLALHDTDHFRCAFDCFLLAVGFGDLIRLPLNLAPRYQTPSAVSLALKHFGDKKKKAAVTKNIKKFQDILGIPPMPGQRSEIGRNQMRQSRKEQIR